MLDEALHEKKIANIADQIARDRKIKMILIAGPSSSGKNNICTKIRNTIKNKQNKTSNNISR